MSDGPNLKGTLGALLRTTLEQAGSFRQVLEREARSTRGWIDATLAARRRRDLLAELGAITYELAVRGELGDLEDYPEIAELVRRVEADEQQNLSQTGPESMADAALADPVWQPVMARAPGKPAVSFVDDPVEDDDTDLADYMNDEDVPPAKDL